MRLSAIVRMSFCFCRAEKKQEKNTYHWSRFSRNWIRAINVAGLYGVGIRVRLKCTKHNQTNGKRYYTEFTHTGARIGLEKLVMYRRARNSSCVLRLRGLLYFSFSISSSSRNQTSLCAELALCECSCSKIKDLLVYKQARRILFKWFAVHIRASRSFDEQTKILALTHCRIAHSVAKLAAVNDAYYANKYQTNSDVWI